MANNLTFEDILERDGKFVYSNKGVSMMPLLREDRDLMIITRKGAARCRKLDVVLFRRQNIAGSASYVLHRILRVNDDGTYWIVGDNCVTGEIVKEENILGIMTGFVRRGRTISVDDWRYQLYVQTWCRFYRARIFLLRCRNYAARCVRRVRDLMR